MCLFCRSLVSDPSMLLTLSNICCIYEILKILFCVNWYKLIQINLTLLRFEYLWKLTTPHCMKSGRIQSFSGPHFPACGLNKESQSKCGKTRTRKTRNADTFHAVLLLMIAKKTISYGILIPSSLARFLENY